MPGSPHRQALAQRWQQAQGLLPEAGAIERDVERCRELTAMLQQSQDNAARANSQIQDAVTNGVGRQLAPVAGMNSKVDAMGDDVRSLRDALSRVSPNTTRA